MLANDLKLLMDAWASAETCIRAEHPEYDAEAVYRAVSEIFDRFFRIEGHPDQMPPRCFTT